MPSKSRPADTAALVSEAAIRDRAYFLWEQAGRPDGGGDHFWHLALHEATQILVELSSSGVARADKQARGAKARNPPKPAATTGKASKPKLKDAEAGKPKLKAKAEAKLGKKAAPKPRAAVQKPK